MKKRILLLLMFLISTFFINLVFASYGCSVGEITTGNSVIDIGKIEPINGIKIALIDSSGGFSAEFLADADSATIFNESNVEVNLISGNYDLKLINLTEDYALIDIEGDKEKIEEGKTEKIDDLQVHALNFQGTYPGGNGEVKVLVGAEYLFLHNTNPASIKTIGGIEYRFELSSSVSGKARIDVKKCLNGRIIEIDDIIENFSDDSNINDSFLQNESSINENNTTTIKNFTISEDLEDTSKEAIEDGFPISPYLITSIIFSIILIIILVILYKRSKEDKDELNNLSKDS